MKNLLHTNRAQRRAVFNNPRLIVPRIDMSDYDTNELLINYQIEAELSKLARKRNKIGLMIREIQNTDGYTGLVKVYKHSLNNFNPTQQALIKTLFKKLTRNDKNN